MKLTPVYTQQLNNTKQNGQSKPSFKKDISLEGKYEDPLLNWPVRGLAYSNEIGVGIKEIAPKLGMLMWVPALMYFGADIYDKYKNDKNSYNPSSKRGFEQAVFQALASVILPTAAIQLGQSTISALAKNSKAGLTLQAKEETSKFLLDYMERHKLYKFANNVDDYKSRLSSSLETYVADIASEHKAKNPIVKLFKALFHPKSALINANPEKLKTFIDQKVDTLFDIRKTLLEGNKPKQLSEKLFRDFREIQPTFKKENAEYYISKAAKHVIKKYEHAQILKPQLLKTLGGFAALGLLIKPIDMFVEKTIMTKFVEPGLSKFK